MPGACARNDVEDKAAMWMMTCDFSLLNSESYKAAPEYGPFLALLSLFAIVFVTHSNYFVCISCWNRFGQDTRARGCLWSYEWWSWAVKPRSGWVVMKLTPAWEGGRGRGWRKVQVTCLWKDCIPSYKMKGQWSPGSIQVYGWKTLHQPLHHYDPTRHTVHVWDHLTSSPCFFFFLVDVMHFKWWMDEWRSFRIEITNYYQKLVKQETRLCVRLLEVINAICKNPQITKHKSVSKHYADFNRVFQKEFYCALSSSWLQTLLNFRPTSTVVVVS